MKQRRRNRHIVQTQWLNPPTAQTALDRELDKELAELRKAQLLLHNFLSQNEIAELNRQLIEAGSIREQYNVLNGWYDATATKIKEPETIYEMAEAAIKSNQFKWPNSKTALIYNNEQVEIYISQYNQELTLVAATSRKSGSTTHIKTERVKCGHLDPFKGWQFTLKRHAYDNWVKKVKGLLK